MLDEHAEWIIFHKRYSLNMALDIVGFNRITARVWSKAQPPYAFRVEKGMD